jgi:hypothetical protein
LSDGTPQGRAPDRISDDRPSNGSNKRIKEMLRTEEVWCGHEHRVIRNVAAELALPAADR